MLSGLWSTAKIDVNNDGLISRDEFVTHFEAELTIIDTEFVEIMAQFMLVARACHARKKQQASLDESTRGAPISSGLAELLARHGVLDDVLEDVLDVKSSSRSPARGVPATLTELRSVSLALLPPVYLQKKGKYMKCDCVCRQV